MEKAARRQLDWQKTKFVVAAGFVVQGLVFFDFEKDRLKYFLDTSHISTIHDMSIGDWLDFFNPFW